MEMDAAIKKLFRHLIRDIVAQSNPYEGLFAERLRRLDTLLSQLASTRMDRWFDRMQPQGEAQAFYHSVVLPLQRDLGWSDGDVGECLQAHIHKMRLAWMLGYMSEPSTKKLSASKLLHVRRAQLKMEVEALRRDRNGYVSAASGDGEVLYFAFVEEVESVPAGRRVYAVSALPIESAQREIEQQHLRLSGIRIEDFVALALQVTPVDPDNVDEVQRDERKRQLSLALEGVALPVLEMFVDRDTRDALGITPGFSDWFLLGHTPSPDEDGIYVYVTNPDDAERPTTESVGLSLLARAPEFWENRLRDIFSLVHVADADFGEDERGNGNPAPAPPVPPNLEGATDVGDTNAMRSVDPPATYMSEN